MQQKNIFLMLALSGSVLMMMLVSVLFFVPSPTHLRADLSQLPKLNPLPIESHFPDVVEEGTYIKNDAEKVLKTIQEYVRDNDPDSAKRLYNELYSIQNQPVFPMGGEVKGLAVR